MPTLTIDTEIHAGQEQVLAEAARFNVLSCGRRWGKTVIAQDRISETAMEQGQPVGYFAPTYKLLAEAWREIEEFYQPTIAHKDKTERRIETLTGGVIEMWTLEDKDAGRSRKYARVIVDEAGLCPNLSEQWNAAIRPTLADLQGDAWFLGTPKGRNYFYQLFLRGRDREVYPEWHSWQMPTGTNPLIAEDEIAEMRREMPERKFRQEILAEFLEDGGVVFRNVRACATAPGQQKAIPGHAYTIGTDWGRQEDATVNTVWDETARQVAAVDRFTRVEYALQRARLRELWLRFGRPVVLAEENSIGGPNIEELRREGISVQPFVTTNETKQQLVDNLILAFEQQSLAILDDPVLIGELEAFDSERLPSGRIRYGAPDGAHDDCVISLALALWASTKTRTTVIG